MGIQVKYRLRRHATRGEVALVLAFPSTTNPRSTTRILLPKFYESLPSLSWLLDLPHSKYAISPSDIHCFCLELEVSTAISCLIINIGARLKINFRPDTRGQSGAI